MSENCELSNVSIRYLSKYYEILEEMIRETIICNEETDSISNDFIIKAIPQYRAAIKICENLLLYTTYVPLQKIAQTIIAANTSGIETMENIMCACKECKNTENEFYVYKSRNDVIVKNMFSHMQRAYADNDINMDFIREMIPHCKGSVEMNRNLLYFPICVELKNEIDNIMRVQAQRICEMEAVMKCIGQQQKNR